MTTGPGLGAARAGEVARHASPADVIDLRDGSRTAAPARDGVRGTPLRARRSSAAALLRAADLQVQTSIAALDVLRGDLARLVEWARTLAEVLGGGGRLLVAGNGGSAAHAQHLTSELVGRFRGDRPAFSALCLSAESSSVTAIANDYGYEHAFARQVEAHARPGDLLLVLSTSGRSTNLHAAVDAAHVSGARTWALTGPAPNPLVERVDDAVAVAASTTAAVQDAHPVAVHVLCATFDTVLGS